MAGHVRFTHATLNTSWPHEDHQPIKLTLPILSSPKPTTTAFYLREHDPQARESRWPPMLRERNNRGDPPPGFLWPTYRIAEAELSGRKFYRRHAPDISGLNADANRMNQSVHAIPPGLSFTFRIYFDNLTDQELAALLFALTLMSPDEWKPSDAGQPLHAIGHGKPFGMGACAIVVDSLQLDHPDRFRADNWSGFGQTKTDSSDAAGLRDRIKTFWQTCNQHVESRAVLQDLVDMLCPIADDIDVAYPPSPSSGDEKFSWWKGKKSTALRLANPIDERSRPSQRLIK